MSTKERAERDQVCTHKTNSNGEQIKARQLIVNYTKIGTIPNYCTFLMSKIRESACCEHVVFEKVGVLTSEGKVGWISNPKNNGFNLKGVEEVLQMCKESWKEK